MTGTITTVLSLDHHKTDQIISPSGSLLSESGRFPGLYARFREHEHETTEMETTGQTLHVNKECDKHLICRIGR